MARNMVAALFVQTGGAYFGLPDVDPWDEARDARRYAGPWPVVAHPPCARWSMLAKQVQSRGGKRLGEDDGCFEAALCAVRRFGGVLEHPAWSWAFARFLLVKPELPKPARSATPIPFRDLLLNIARNAACASTSKTA